MGIEIGFSIAEHNAFCVAKVTNLPKNKNIFSTILSVHIYAHIGLTKNHVIHSVRSRIIKSNLLWKQIWI